MTAGIKLSRAEKQEMNRIAKLQNISAQAYFFLKTESAEQIENPICMDGKKWVITISVKEAK